MVTRAGGSIALRPKIEANIKAIRVAFIEKVGHLDVWHVDGKVIRDRVYIDFTEGGNSQAYIWMPPHEIWLDHDVSPREVNCVKLHELHEYNKMCGGMSYEPAHESANGVEQQARNDPSVLGRLWRTEVRKLTENPIYRR